MSHRWVGPRPLTRVGGEDVAPGDTFEPTEAEQRSFGKAIEPVDTGEDSDGDSDDEVAESEPAEWDEDEWLDGGYQDRADLVRTGAVDDYLDEIEAVETSETVLDAVAARREA